jgi:tRNA A-37 threonylcarbamoyl transferase component Bud32
VPYEVGDLIDGQFRVERRYTGGMGHVYIVRHEVVNKRFAIKQLAEAQAQLPILQERFRREAAAWLQLDYHPHIVQAHTYHETPQGPILILEYVDGPSLEVLLRKEGRLSPAEAVAYTRQICQAMQYAHNKEIPGRGQGVLHRDLKPSNILLTRTNRVKVTDFGLAKIGGDIRITREDQFLGTAVYSSPEQIRAAGKVTPASDIYSTGVVLYQMLCGETPFRAQSHAELFLAIQKEEPVPPHIRCPDIDPELSRVVMRCLAKDPRARYASFEQLDAVLASLEPLLQNPNEWQCGLCRYRSRQVHTTCPVCGKASGRRLAAEGRESVWVCSCGASVPTHLSECACCGRLVPLLDSLNATGRQEVVEAQELEAFPTVALKKEWETPFEEPHLVVLHPGGLLQPVPLKKTIFPVGRDERMKLSLPDAGVSKQHVFLVQLRCGWLAISRKEDNLAVFNGWPLPQRLLRPGDLLRLGNTWLVFVERLGQEHVALGLLPGLWNTKADLSHLYLGEKAREAAPEGIKETTCTVTVPGEAPVVSSGRPLVVGSAAICTVRVQGSGVAPVHALLAWRPDGLGIWRLAPGLALKVDGQPVTGTVVQRGIRLEVGVVPLKVAVEGPVERPGQFYQQVVQRPRRLAITAVRGPYEGQTAVLEEGQSYVVGRDASSDICLTTDTYVSRRHLKLTANGPHLELEDLGSRNGFFLNRVACRTTAVAQPGDLLTIGRTSFVVHRELIPDPW